MSFIPIEDLFANPVKAGAGISPDGRRIAFLAPEQDRLNVWVQDLDGDAEAVCVTHEHSTGVFRYHWTDDPRWLLYLRDSGGDENDHLYRIDLEDLSAPPLDLTPKPGTRVMSVEQPSGLPGTAILNVIARDLGVIDAVAIDIATGEQTKIWENPGTFMGWMVADNGTVFASIQTATGDFEVYDYDHASAQTRLLVTVDGSGSPVGVHPMQLTADGTGLLIGSTLESDLSQLVRIDLATGKRTLVDSHPSFDVDVSMGALGGSALVLDRSSHEVIGVRYRGERSLIQPLDPHFADVLGKLQTLSEGDVAGLSSDLAGMRWTVSFTHDRDPYVNYFYDHSTGESRLLFRPYPQLDPSALAPMTPVTITARDGLTLPSYLTLPLGVEPVSLPMVLVVHGGPWMRDMWGFDPGVQHLANRGYAVLQVNFRGSSGYGKKHITAAIGQLAGTMHDDLIDGVQWAISEGIADPSRVAIYGGSYGGYSALVGAAFTPDVFACAIDYCGISSLPNFMETLPPFVRPFLTNNWFLYGGNPDIPEQREDLLARSPITKVDQIKIPMMVAQGSNDVRVVQAESDNIVEELRARGIPVEYMVKADEGHGFVNPENVMDMHRVMEKFLAEHLVGPST